MVSTHPFPLSWPRHANNETGSIEQAISTHPLVAESCVVGIPDSLKGQLPFAFITLSEPDHPTSAVPDKQISAEIQKLVRGQVGAIATLGGIVQGESMIPKTRSGKMLRRVLRDMIENASRGELAKEVAIPSTIEDASTVEIARAKIGEYFQHAAVANGEAEDMVKARL